MEEKEGEEEDASESRMERSFPGLKADSHCEARWQPLNHRWLGPEYSESDFSGRYKVVWTPERIYLLAEIVDDILIDIINPSVL